MGILGELLMTEEIVLFGKEDLDKVESCGTYKPNKPSELVLLLGELSYCYAISNYIPETKLLIQILHKREN